LTLRWVGRHTGIEELCRLKSLNADADVLYDLSVLEPLQELERLRLTASNHGFDGPPDSYICDVRPLKHLPKLRTLEIDFDSDDLSGFSELKQLRRLSLDIMSRFCDLAPLTELTQLESLSVQGDYLSNIAPLAELTQLESLSVHGDCLSNIEPLSALTGLTYLGVGRKIKSLEPVRTMEHLQCLDCAHSHIRTLKPLQKLTELRELHIQDSAVRSVEPLRNLKKLTLLNLGSTNVQDISPLAGLKELSWLCLNGRISDLSPLAYLKELQELHLNGYNSYIRWNAAEVDLAPLSGLEKLTVLNANCPVKSLEPLRGLLALRSLRCRERDISSAEPLPDLINVSGWRG
jgi:internalin A